jgi:hypothetical protein
VEEKNQEKIDLPIRNKPRPGQLPLGKIPGHRSSFSPSESPDLLADRMCFSASTIHLEGRMWLQPIRTLSFKVLQLLLLDMCHGFLSLIYLGLSLFSQSRDIIKKYAYIFSRQ